MRPRSILLGPIAITCAFAFLWLNMSTAMSVAPWVDEVMQVDAGVNLYLGNGWVSTAWQSQSQYEFWAANNPLYTLIVYFWISIFGFTPVAARSLNYVLAVVVTWLIVDTSQRKGWVRSIWAQAMLAALIICDQAFTFVYRSGRADLVTMLVVALLFRTYTCVGDPIRRRVLLFSCAFLMPPSGLHSMPYVVLLLCLEYLFSRKLRVADLSVIGLGGTVGGLALTALFLWKHSLTAYVSQTFASGYNVFGAGLQAAIIGDHAAIARLFAQIKALSPENALQAVGADTSVLPLIIFLLSLLLLLWREGNSTARSVAIAGLVAAVLIPYGMLAAGRYAFYYAWMGAAPLAVAFSVSVEKLWIARQRLLVWFGITAATVSIWLGMPSIVWREVQKVAPAEYSAIDRILRDEAQPGDVIYGDPVLYYAAKMVGIPFFSTSYAGGRAYPRMAENERSRISVLIVSPEQVSPSFEKLGSGWTQGRTYQLPYGSSLAVYRRTIAQAQ